MPLPRDHRGDMGRDVNSRDQGGGARPQEGGSLKSQGGVQRGGVGCWGSKRDSLYSPQVGLGARMYRFSYR